jgi:hypothetical protein
MGESVPRAGMPQENEGGSLGSRLDAWRLVPRGIRGNDSVSARKPDSGQDKGFFDDQEKTILIIILAGIILIGLVMGSSCNLHIEIKQKPSNTKVEGAEK